MSANKPKTTGEGSGTGDGKMADENMELDERKVKILDAVIRNYLATGEPVGSRTISKYTDLNLSSATIRNEMADLCLLYTSPSPRDPKTSRMPSSA